MSVAKKNELPLFTAPVHPFKFENAHSPHGPSIHRQLLRRSCYERGLRVNVDPGNDARWTALSDRAAVRFYRNMPPTTTPAGLKVAYNKFLTKTYLQAGGVSAPEGIDLNSTDFEAARTWFERHSGGLAVVKPLSGFGGRGVSSGIANAEDLVAAMKNAGSKKVVLEQHVNGADHRLFVLGGRFIAAVRRHPAKVTGDGSSTIQELIDRKNKLRLKLPYIRNSLILVDDKVSQILANQALDLGSVPMKGQEVKLREVANVSLGGDNEDVTPIVHPDFQKVAEACWRSIPGLTFCGVDLIAEDISKPKASQQYSVIEVNPNCNISLHHFLTIDSGTPPLDVAGAIIDYVFPDLPAPIIKTEEWHMSGVVQGVGYRAWTQRQAQILAITGHCENLSDGRVRAVAQGTEPALEELRTRCARGPNKAIPHRVDVTPHHRIPDQVFSILNRFSREPTDDQSKTCSGVAENRKLALAAIRLGLRAQSYYPDSAQKSTEQRIIDILSWLEKSGEVNRFYYAYGLDRANGPSAENFLPYCEFRQLRDGANSAAGAAKKTLRDKGLFSAAMQGLGLKTPLTIAMLENGRVSSTVEKIKVLSDLQSRHSSIFCKPVDGIMGKGAFRVEMRKGFLPVVNGEEVSWLEICKRMEGRYIIQASIQQHREIARLHPSSVNTVRIVSAHMRGEPRPLFACLRVGSGGQSVDNWASSGIIVKIDMDTGRLTGPGFFKPGKGTLVHRHPDTDIEFHGHEIPFFDEALEMSVQAHKRFPLLHSVGWDFAITSASPLIIEGNDNWDGAIPMTLDHDFKTRFLETLKERTPAATA